MSKTISMPLEEYERELANARKSGQDDAYRKGATEMALQITAKIDGYATGEFIDSGLAKLVIDTVTRIKKSLAPIVFER